MAAVAVATLICVELQLLESRRQPISVENRLMQTCYERACDGLPKVLQTTLDRITAFAFDLFFGIYSGIWVEYGLVA